MKKFARSIVSNLFTLLLSLALAILIWFNAQESDDPLRSEFLSIPITVIGQPDNSLLLDPPADRRVVQIVFEGPTSVVTQLTVEDFSASIDLTEVPFGEEATIPIAVQPKVDNVTLRSQQLEITVLLEQLVTRDIPVILDVRSEVARGYSQGIPLVDPEVITVSGPASSVAELDSARVTVFLNNAREDIFDSRQPVFYDQQGRVASVRGLDLSTGQVDITIPVVESAGYAEKFIDVDIIGEPAPGYRVLSINVSPISVLIQGRPTLLSQVDRVQTEPIDITGLTEPYLQQVTLALPDGVTQDEGEEIFVEIDIEPFFTTDTYNPIVVVQGLDETLEATVEPESVRVVLFGPLPALEALLDEEVRVTVDLFGLITGTYSLEPDVSFPDRGIELRSIQPSQVTVNITRLLTITNEITGTLSVTETDSVRVTNNIVMRHTTPEAGRQMAAARFFHPAHAARSEKIMIYSSPTVRLLKRVFP